MKNQPKKLTHAEYLEYLTGLARTCLFVNEETERAPIEALPRFPLGDLQKAEKLLLEALERQDALIHKAIEVNPMVATLIQWEVDKELAAQDKADLAAAEQEINNLIEK